MKITASDRSSLIRLATELPAGSEERRAILSGLTKVGMEFDTKEALEKYLKDHPDADKSLHSVKKEKKKEKKEKADPESREKAENLLNSLSDDLAKDLGGKGAKTTSRVDGAWIGFSMKMDGKDEKENRELAFDALEAKGWKKVKGEFKQGEHTIPRYEKDGQHVYVSSHGDEVELEVDTTDSSTKEPSKEKRKDPEGRKKEKDKKEDARFKPKPGTPNPEETEKLLKSMDEEYGGKDAVSDWIRVWDTVKRNGVGDDLKKKLTKMKKDYTDDSPRHKKTDEIIDKVLSKL